MNTSLFSNSTNNLQNQASFQFTYMDNVCKNLERNSISHNMGKIPTQDGGFSLYTY